MIGIGLMSNSGGSLDWIRPLEGKRIEKFREVQMFPKKPKIFPEKLEKFPEMW